MRVCRTPYLNHFNLTLALALIAVLSISCSLNPAARKQKYVASGQRYFDGGKYSEASIEFLNAVKIDPNDAQAHSLLGKSYLKLQQWPRAYDELKRATELDPANYAMRFDLAKLLVASGSFQAAREQIDLLTKDRPNDAKTHFISGTLLAAQGSYPAAIGEIQQAIAIDPSDWDSYLNLALMQMKNSQPDLAESNFKKAIELNPRAADAHTMLGNFYQFRGQFDKAENQFHAAIEVEPQDPNLRATLARLYIAENKKPEAEQLLERGKRDFPDNSIGYRMLGDFYYTSGDLNKALAEYANLFHDHPKDVEVENNYIQLLIVTNRFDDARKLDDEVLNKRPDDDKGLLYSGEIQIHDGRVNDAIATLQKLTKNNPSDAAAHDQLGVALQKYGDQESAEREWREAVRLEPDLADAQRSLALLAMHKGDMATLAEASTQLISLQPANPEGYALRAISEINRKQFTAAETDVQKSIATAPQSQLGYVQMGNLKFVEGQYNEAEKSYQQALDRDANSADALRGLMNSYIAQKQADKAIAVAEAQISKSPNNGNFYDLLGTAFFHNKKDLGAAETAFKKSAELNRENPDPVIKLGQLLASEGKIDDAIGTYRSGLTTFPREMNLYLLLGDLYQSKHDWPNAESAYQKALLVKPENPLASGKLAYVMLQSGENLDVALSLAQTARRGLPESPGVVDTLGLVYYQKGAYQSAIDFFQEALKLERDTKSPSNPQLHFHLGMAYAKSGQPSLARQQLQLVLKTDTNPTEVENARKQLAQL